MKIFDILNFAQSFVGVLLLLLGVYTLRYNDRKVSKTLFWFLILTSFWCIFSVLINKSNDLEMKIFLNRIKFFAPLFLPTVILSLGFDLNNEVKVKKSYFYIPACFFAFVMMSPWHELIVRDYSLTDIGGTDVLIYKYGPVYLIHNILSRLFCLASFIIIIKGISGRHRYQKVTGWVIVAAIALPFLVDTIGVNFYPLFRDLQLVPISLGFTGVLITYVLFIHGSLDILPYARSSIVSSLSEACLMWDYRGALVDSNPSGVELFNIPSDIRKFNSDDFPYLKTNDHEVIWKDGRFFQVKYEKIFDKENRSNGSYTLMRDVTKIKQAEEVLVKMNQVKTNILGVLSHDLCGHAGQLSLMTELLMLGKEELSDKEKTELAEGAFSLSKDLTFFLSNLLEWSKDQFNGWEIRQSPIETSQLIDETWIFLSKIAILKKQNMINNIKSGVRLSSDIKMLEIILRNLIYNSIKHSPNESLIIIEGGEKEIRITNTGDMTDRDIDSVNIYFSDSKSNQAYGYGLGHKICKEFSLALGVIIEAKKKEDKITFILNFS